MVGDDSAQRTPHREARDRRWLVRAGDHQPFAYSRGHDFYRASDHGLWAHLSDDGWLLSARSGAPIAYRSGSYFYDSENHMPVFYERA